MLGKRDFLLKVNISLRCHHPQRAWTFRGKRLIPEVLYQILSIWSVIALEGCFKNPCIYIQHSFDLTPREFIFFYRNSGKCYSIRHWNFFRNSRRNVSSNGKCPKCYSFSRMLWKPLYLYTAFSWSNYLNKALHLQSILYDKCNKTSLWCWYNWRRHDSCQFPCGILQCLQQVRSLWENNIIVELLENKKILRKFTILAVKWLHITLIIIYVSIY